MSNKLDHINIDLKLNDNSNNYSNPLLCKFPTIKPDINNLNSNNLSERSLIPFSKGNKPEDYLIAGFKNNICYQGKVKINESTNCKYAVGFYCKRKRKLIISEVYNLLVSQFTQCNHNNENKEKHLDKKINYLENKSLLVTDFGTNKSKKVMESMKGNIVKEQNISAPKAMQDIISKKTLEEENQAKINQVDGESNNKANFKNILPLYNLKTKDVSKIFDLTSIIPSHILEKIEYQDYYRLALDGNINKLKDELTEFVFNTFKNYEKLLESSCNINLAFNMQLAISLEYYLRFYNLPRVIYRSKHTLVDELKMETDFMQYLLDNFAQISVIDGRHKLVKTQDLTLKCFYYSVILAFSTNNYEFDARILCKSMKMEEKEMFNKLKILGCTFPNVKKEKKEESEGKGKVRKIKSFEVKLKAPLDLKTDQGFKKR